MPSVTSQRQIPRIPDVSFLTGNLSDFRNNRLGLLERTRQECGEIGSFRLGPASVVIINSVALASTVLVSRADEFGRGPLVRNFVPLIGKDSMVVLHGEKHRRIRKIAAPTFQHRRIVELAPPMVECAYETFSSLKEGALVDVNQVMTELTLNIVGRTLFDVDFSGDSTELRDAMVTSIEHLDYMASTLLPIPLPIPTARNRKTQKALRTIRTRVQEMVDERRRNGTHRRDLLSAMLESRDEHGNALNDDEVRDNIVTFFSAGHESTALALCWTWYLLARHPQVYAKAKAEVDSVLGGRPPTFESLSKMGYTLQTIKESLRLFPAILLLARAPLRDIELEGYPIRKGQMVFISPYCLHRDPEVFPEPHLYDPDRFSPERERQIPRNSYLPFGTGPQVCIGSHFAMMEAHLIIASLLQLVDFELAEEGEVAPETLTVTLRPKRFHMRIKRKRAEQAPVPLRVAL